MLKVVINKIQENTVNKVFLLGNNPFYSLLNLIDFKYKKYLLKIQEKKDHLGVYQI